VRASEACELNRWIPDDNIKPEHVHEYRAILARAQRGINPDVKESAFFQEVYRYTNGGGDKEKQPFKPYRRKTSWGVR